MARAGCVRRIAPLFLVVSLSAPALSPSAASADPISDKRTEAEKVADRLEELRMEVEILAEQFNDARLAATELKRRAKAASERAEEAKSSLEAAEEEIADFAVTTYVHGGTDTLATLAMLEDKRPEAAQRRKYASAVMGSRNKVVEAYRSAQAKAEKEIAALAEAREEARAAEARVGAKKKATEEAVAEQMTVAERIDGELAELVRLEEERREAATAAQERREAAARAQQAEAPAPAAPRRATPAEPAAPSAPEPAPAPAPAPPPAPTAPVEPPAGDGAARAIAAGKTQLGVPYLWAGESPETGFDCSGFVLWAWAQGGKTLPHSSRAMYAMSTKIPMSELRPGDLVFYGQPTLHHVALYMGGGQIIHSPSSGDVVKISDVYYWDELVGAGRV